MLSQIETTSTAKNSAKLKNKQGLLPANPEISNT